MASRPTIGAARRCVQQGMAANDSSHDNNWDDEPDAPDDDWQPDEFSTDDDAEWALDDDEPLPDDRDFYLDDPDEEEDFPCTDTLSQARGA